MQVATILLHKHGGTALAWDSLVLGALPGAGVGVAALCGDSALATHVQTWPAR